jgi:hypothetical protein
MRRNKRPRHDNTQELFQTLRRIIESPLGQIGLELELQLNFVCDRDAAGKCEPSLLKVVTSTTEAIVRMLPLECGERFEFDAQMIDAIKTAWNQDGQHLSNIIIPNYGPEWSHASAFIPSGSGGGLGKSINVVYIPGHDNLEDIDILTYPFMCHELGHNLFYYDDSLFIECFEKELKKVVGSLHLRALPDKGSAVARSHRIIDEMQKLWTPTLDHKNWSHETAMDMIALWTCGPTYLAVFQDTVEDKTKDPYLIGQEHPPYALRVEALINAGEQLGWSHHTRGLKRIVKEWRNSRWSKKLTNRYVSLTDPRLIDACVSCALAACEKLALPRCDAREIERVRGLLHRNEMPNFGTEIILAAWLIEQEQGENAYEMWEQETVHKMSGSIT